MKLFSRDFHALVRSHGLAACCIVAPLLMGMIALNAAAEWLIPATVKEVRLEYTLRPKVTPPPQAKERGDQADTEKGKTEAKALPDSQMQPVALHLSGSYGYAAASAFLYLSGIASLLFGIAVVGSRLGRSTVYISLAAFVAISAYVAMTSTGYDLGRPLVLDNILNSTDGNSLYRGLVPAGRGTGRMVAHFVNFNTFVSLVPVGMILTALYALSIRPPAADIDVNDLTRRLTAIRVALGLGSATLVIAVLASKTLLSWPSSLLVEEQALALKPLADSLTMHLGASGTIALIAAFAPAIVAWSLDVETYKNHNPTRQTAPATSAEPAKPSAPDHELVFAPMSMITSLLAVLAPLLASPLFDGLKGILGPLVQKGG